MFKSFVKCRWGPEEVVNKLYEINKSIITSVLSGNEIVNVLDKDIFIKHILTYEDILKRINYTEVVPPDMPMELWDAVKAYACVTYSLLRMLGIRRLKEFLSNDVIVAVSVMPMFGMDYILRSKYVKLANALIDEYRTYLLYKPAMIDSPNSISRVLAVLSMSASTMPLINKFLHELKIRSLTRLFRLMISGYAPILCKPKYTDVDVQVISAYAGFVPTISTPPFSKIIRLITRSYVDGVMAMKGAQLAYAICRGITDTMAVLAKSVYR